MSSSGTSAARLSLAVIIGLVVLKITAGAITGSLSIIAQAVDSLLDIVAVAITLFAVRTAIKPADGEHPFGHGKVEGIAAIAQAMLILAAGISIIYSAVHRIIVGSTVELAEAGMVVMVVSIVASIFLSRYLLRVSREVESVALEANAHNIAADVYSAAAVLAGLVAVRLTGLNIIDPIIALIVAVFILKIAYNVLRKSFGELTDTKLPEAEEKIIRASITEHVGELIDFHKLRTRKSGRQRYIDLHLVMPKTVSVEEAHRLCDHLERDIRDKLRHASVTIHVEPCSDECAQCPITCPEARNKPQAKPR